MKKKHWGALKGTWVPHDTRDEIVDYVKHWTERAETSAKKLLAWIGLATSKFHTWKDRSGRANEHNGKVPRDHWLEIREKEAILDFHDLNPLEGYRRLTFMMLDREIVAVSPAAVYRESNGKLERWHGSVKTECIRISCPATLEEARRKIAAYVQHYNQVRSHSALGYVAPADYLAGKATEIYAARDRKLEAARAKRKLARLDLLGVA